jgi:hypothetical protein
MIMRSLLRIALLALAFVLGTALVGWWTVPLLAAIWGVLAFRVPRAGVLAGLAAMIAWALLLAMDMRADAFAELSRALAGVVGLPRGSLFALTLVYPALLAWSAARVTAVATTLLRGASDAQSVDAADVGTSSERSSAGDRPREVYASK